jgi:hypothetical protein
MASARSRRTALAQKPRVFFGRLTPSRTLNTTYNPAAFARATVAVVTFMFGW